MTDKELTLAVAGIAAASALAGVVLSQVVVLLNSYLENKRQKKMVLSQKYEDAGRLFLASLQWFPDIQRSTSLEMLQARSLCIDARQSHFLCSIYFPELVAASENYLDSLFAFSNFLITIFDPKLPHNVGTQAAAHHEGKFLELANAVRACRQHVDEGFQIYASRYSIA